ncbi:unnamed protein product [marine sediment metagenome]|uniref:Uncharacterized protein n=1 Tax=marine sediment metagenome TaxID=412755 RepID=X0V4S5_9ZZZZ
MELKTSGEILKGYDGLGFESQEVLEEYDNTKWVKASEVAERINKIVTYTMKEELLQELGDLK